jgi:hypothetical protein
MRKNSQRPWMPKKWYLRIWYWGILWWIGFLLGSRSDRLWRLKSSGVGLSQEKRTTSWRESYYWNRCGPMKDWEKWGGWEEQSEGKIEQRKFTSIIQLDLCLAMVESEFQINFDDQFWGLANYRLASLEFHSLSIMFFTLLLTSMTASPFNWVLWGHVHCQHILTQLWHKWDKSWHLSEFR